MHQCEAILMSLQKPLDALAQTQLARLLVMLLPVMSSRQPQWLSSLWMLVETLRTLPSTIFGLGHRASSTSSSCYTLCIYSLSRMLDTFLSSSFVNDFSEIAACYGTHCTRTGLQAHLTRDVNPNVKLIQEARRQGVDPQNVILIEGVRDGNPGKG